MIFCSKKKLTTCRNNPLILFNNIKLVPFSTNLNTIIVINFVEKTMDAKDEFEFLNSEIWLNYTQQRYLSPREIEYRLRQQNKLPSSWRETQKKIIVNRQIGSIPLFLRTIDKKFWFFPSDSITQRINEIEKLGIDLYNQINQHSVFAQDFLLNSTIEEAITSAIYEGAHSTRAKAQQLIASKAQPKNKDEWMLINNYVAMDWVHKHRSEPLSKEVLLELHRIVTRNTLEGDDVNFSGKFRNDKVFVGGKHEPPKHEGIDFRLIEGTIDEAVQLSTKNPRYIHPLLKGILIHYFIAYIHPFFDGNGRTARALFYFKSMRNHLAYVQLLSVSAYLKEHGKQYEDAFEKVVENDLDVTYFVDFCLDSIYSALTVVSKKVEYLLRITQLRESLKLTNNQIGLLQRMSLHKFRMTSIEEYAQQIKMSREIARQELKLLTEFGLTLEFKQSKKLVYKIDKEKLDALLET